MTILSVSKSAPASVITALMTAASPGPPQQE